MAGLPPTDTNPLKFLNFQTTIKSLLKQRGPQNWQPY